MFKAVQNLREQKGFTLIELLIVIAIIGILAAIAIPAFLGQREKAKIRSVEASAKGAVSEIQAVLDSYVSATAFLLLDDAGAEKCYESTLAPPSKKCNAMYPGTPTATYTTIEDVRTAIIKHHQGKQEKSPYNAADDLFKESAVDPPVTTAGQIAIINGGRSFKIKAYAEALGAGKEIFNTTVTSR